MSQLRLISWTLIRRIALSERHIKTRLLNRKTLLHDSAYNLLYIPVVSAVSTLQFFESENLSWFKYILEIYSAKPVGRHGDQDEVSPRPPPFPLIHDSFTATVFIRLNAARFINFFSESYAAFNFFKGGGYFKITFFKPLTTIMITLVA